MAKAQPRATELQQAGETASALTKRTERLNNQEPIKSSRPREKEYKINPSGPGAEEGGKRQHQHHVPPGKEGHETRGCGDARPSPARPQED